MCKENKNCQCNGQCRDACQCKSEEMELLVISFEDEQTGNVERYYFIAEFEYKGERIMAVTLVDGDGEIEFVTCDDEESETAEFIYDEELKECFGRKLIDDNFEEWIAGMFIEDSEE